ncbi:MAG: hypothetical protein CMC89_02965 [Flavobacteriaceae bacterium]|nr:hypothetical protein [Flavobacteriaceae bacterium]|tara:strand:- start:3086 stop:3466 length:381 start_codon:yes stop_codon:yes gene_type:complete
MAIRGIINYRKLYASIVFRKLDASASLIQHKSLYSDVNVKEIYASVNHVKVVVPSLVDPNHGLFFRNLFFTTSHRRLFLDNIELNANPEILAFRDFVTFSDNATVILLQNNSLLNSALVGQPLLNG